MCVCVCVCVYIYVHESQSKDKWNFFFKNQFFSKTFSANVLFKIG